MIPSSGQKPPFSFHFFPFFLLPCCQYGHSVIFQPNFIANSEIAFRQTRLQFQIPQSVLTDIFTLPCRAFQSRFFTGSTFFLYFSLTQGTLRVRWGEKWSKIHSRQAKSLLGRTQCMSSIHILWAESLLLPPDQSALKGFSHRIPVTYYGIIVIYRCSDSSF